MAWCRSRLLLRRRAARRLGPQPLGVAGEALVQPDVVPATAAVTALPNHWWASSWAMSRCASQSRLQVVGAEGRQRLRLERDLERVVGDDDGVGVERVRPEELGEGARASAAGRRTRRGRPASGPAARRALTGRRGAGLGLEHVAADLEGGEVGGHRLRAARAPTRPDGRPGARAVSVAVGDDAVAGVGAHRDPVGGLVGHPVVAREPGRGAVRLGGDEDAVGELLPAGRAVGPGHRCAAGPGRRP